ncbi:hypothetical protein PVL30_002288 [Lodderomyces elongisporus]|uniref:uncharacterized protein n=1 Tax=Lodderomyces elongisporus TaxID=36914 RepID=UPI00291DF01F|nr:uncharacterized protein PVL30_002288 [Lodderomyces elongisporus]WLF78548.1 hypothetical protein PVL30_002288 [Lodderomyces elongisporus]
MSSRLYDQINRIDWEIGEVHIVKKSDRIQFYRPELFHQACTFQIPVPIFITDLHHATDLFRIYDHLSEFMDDIIMIQNWPIGQFMLGGRVVGVQYNAKRELVKLNIDDNSGAQSIVVVEMDIAKFNQSGMKLEKKNYGLFVEIKCRIRKGKVLVVEELTVCGWSEFEMAAELRWWTRVIEYREKVLKNPWVFKPEHRLNISSSSLQQQREQNQHLFTKEPLVYVFSQREMTRREMKKNLHIGVDNSDSQTEQSQEVIVVEDSIEVNKSRFEKEENGKVGKVGDKKGNYTDNEANNGSGLDVGNRDSNISEGESLHDLYSKESGFFKSKPSFHVPNAILKKQKKEPVVIDLTKPPTADKYQEPLVQVTDSRRTTTTTTTTNAVTSHKVQSQMQVPSSQKVEEQEIESLRKFQEQTCYNKERFVQLVKECLVVMIKSNFQSISLKQLCQNKYVSLQIKDFAEELKESGTTPQNTTTSELSQSVVHRLRLYFRQSTFIDIKTANYSSNNSYNNSKNNNNINNNSDLDGDDDILEMSAFKLIYNSLLRAFKYFNEFNVIKYIEYVKAKEYVTDIDQKTINFLIKYHLLITKDRSWKYQKDNCIWVKVKHVPP